MNTAPKNSGTSVTKIIWAGILGALFGLGLAMSKMLDPQVALDWVSHRHQPAQTIA